MADVFEDTLDLVQLAIIAVVAFLAYRAYQYVTNKGGTNCGPNGGESCCSPSEVGTDACVSEDGSPCGQWEFWTATTCY